MKLLLEISDECYDVLCDRLQAIGEPVNNQKAEKEYVLLRDGLAALRMGRDRFNSELGERERDCNKVAGLTEPQDGYPAIVTLRLTPEEFDRVCIHLYEPTKEAQRQLAVRHTEEVMASLGRKLEGAFPRAGI